MSQASVEIVRRQFATVHDGLIPHLVYFSDHAQALAAVGLSE
jgi:hypothetical protein